MTESRKLELLQKSSEIQDKIKSICIEKKIALEKCKNDAQKYKKIQVKYNKMEKEAEAERNAIFTEICEMLKENWKHE